MCVCEPKIRCDIHCHPRPGQWRGHGRARGWWGIIYSGGHCVRVDVILLRIAHSFDALCRYVMVMLHVDLRGAVPPMSRRVSMYTEEIEQERQTFV